MNCIARASAAEVGKAVVACEICKKAGNKACALRQGEKNQPRSHSYARWVQGNERNK